MNCNECTSNTSNFTTCLNCNQKCHIHCLTYTNGSNWICNHCLNASLPFYNCTDIAPLQGVYSKAHFPLDDDEIACTNPLDIDFKLPIQQNLVSCNYYTIQTFNELQSDENLFLFHLNSRSLNKNFSNICDFLSILKNDFSVIGISETWLNDHNISPLICLNNYNLLEKHRENRGGGVCMFVKNDLTYHKREDLSLFNIFIESLFIELKVNGYKNNILIGIIYRPPSTSIASFIENLNYIISKINGENKQCFIMGDFNINILKESSSNFLTTIYSNGFYPLITKPTRVSHTSSTLIDNIITIVSQSNAFLSGVLITDLTDHFPVFCKSLIHDASDKKNLKTRNYSQTNINSFVSKVANIDWSIVYDEYDVNNAYDVFYYKLSTLYDECFPFVQQKNRKRKRHPWITNGILTSIKTKNKLLRISLKQPSYVNKLNYRSYRNKLNHVIRIAKKKHFSLKFKELSHDPKGTWSVINNLLNKGKNKSNISDCFTDGDNNVHDPNVIANAFNEYFVNIGPSLAKNIHSHSSANDYLDDANKCSMFFFPVTQDEIIKISSHCLKANKADQITKQ